MKTKRYGLLLLILIVMSIWVRLILAQDDIHTIEYDNIRFSFPSFLATGIQAETIDAYPITQPDEQFLYEHYPEHIRFRFLNYLGGTEFRLPYLIEEPQILVYPVDAMHEFAYDFVDQPNALAKLLLERPDLSSYVRATVRPPEMRLPFLPWVNSGQMMRTHAQYLEIAGLGSGIRYVSRHSQEADHLTDKQIFYTFQGIVADGAYYISAILPVKTGVLPEAVDTSGIDWDEFAANYSEHYLPEVFAQIDSLPDDAFYPPLSTLDSLIQSIVFDGEELSWQTYTNVAAGFRFQYPPDRQICAFESGIELIQDVRYYDDPNSNHCALAYQANPISILYTEDDTAFQAFRAENYPDSFVDYQEETVTISNQSAISISGTELETGLLFELFKIERNGKYLIFKVIGDENITILREIIATLHFMSDDNL